MTRKSSHSEIIKQVCKEMLLPMGVFQKGNSRLYIDDNGWFLTLIEFQPSGWSKGTALNVSLHFLWLADECLSYDFPFGAGREKSHVEYTDDIQFEQAVREYAEFARQRILFYRKLRHMSAAKCYARKWMWQYRKNPHARELKNIWRLSQADLLNTIRQRRTYLRSQPGMGGLPRCAPYDSID